MPIARLALFFLCSSHQGLTIMFLYLEDLSTWTRSDTEWPPVTRLVIKKQMKEADPM
jgi:hypothetical protein